MRCFKRGREESAETNLQSILESHSSITSSLQLSVKRFSSITFLKTPFKMALLRAGFGTPRRGILMPSLVILIESSFFRIPCVAFGDFYVLTLGNQ